MPPPDRTVIDEPLQNSKGVAVILTVQVFSAIAFSMVFSLLMLYLLFKLHLSQASAYELVAAYNALGYATSILGGYLAERYLGYRFTVLLSLIIGGAGLIVLAVPNIFALHLGLACYSLSYGILIPAIFVLLGRLHPASLDSQRDRNFILAYIGMDVGAFVAAISSGYISTYVSYSLAFLVGVIFLIIAFLVFFHFKKIFVVSASEIQPKKYLLKNKVHARIIGVVLTLLCVPVLLVLFDHAKLCNSLLIVMGIGCVFFIMNYAKALNNVSSGKLMVFLVLLTISTVFDASYLLSPSVLTVFTNSNIDKTIFGMPIPTAAYSALNPLFVITLGPALSRVWDSFSRRNKKISLPNRFAIGILMMGCGYLILMLGTGHSNSENLISAWWLAGGFLFQTVGELFISPAGYSMVGLLVPLSLEGTMMGISQFSTGVAGALSGFLADWVSPPAEAISKEALNLWYQHAFGCLSLLSWSVAIIIICLAPSLNRLAGRAAKIEFDKEILYRKSLVLEGNQDSIEPS